MFWIFNHLFPSRLIIKSSHACLKFSPKPFFGLNPPHVWPGGVYPPSGTLGAPIRAAKPRYVPRQRPSFPCKVPALCLDNGTIPTQPPASLDFPYTLPRGKLFGNGWNTLPPFVDDIFPKFGNKKFLSTTFDHIKSIQNHGFPRAQFSVVFPNNLEKTTLCKSNSQLQQLF